jgi:hypothetical protein
MSKIFRIIFICSLIIYSSCDDACVDHSKDECASDTTNNCEWKITTAEGCANSCVSKTTEDTCTGTCTWTKETGTCADIEFDCTNVIQANCGDASHESKLFCEWDTEDSSCKAVTLSCSGKNVDDCKTASDTCTWTKATDGSCGISGDDACTANTKEEDCTGSCSWIDEVGTCSTKSTTTNNDNNDKDSCGFLKMSLSIFVLVLFF